MNIDKDEKFLDEEKDENSQGAKAETNETETSSNDVSNEEADSAKEASTIEKQGLKKLILQLMKTQTNLKIKR